MFWKHHRHFPMSVYFCARDQIQEILKTSTEVFWQSCFRNIRILLHKLLQAKIKMLCWNRKELQIRITTTCDIQERWRSVSPDTANTWRVRTAVNHSNSWRILSHNLQLQRHFQDWTVTIEIYIFRNRCHFTLKLCWLLN